MCITFPTCILQKALRAIFDKVTDYPVWHSAYKSSSKKYNMIGYRVGCMDFIFNGFLPVKFAFPLQLILAQLFMIFDILSDYYMVCANS